LSIRYPALSGTSTRNDASTSTARPITQKVRRDRLGSA